MNFFKIIFIVFGFLIFNSIALSESHDKDQKNIVEKAKEINQKVKKEDSEAVLRCFNYDCPKQVKGRIIHFASKNALDIDGLGEKIVHQLVDKGMVQKVDDIFKLKLEWKFVYTQFQKAKNFEKIFIDRRKFFKIFCFLWLRFDLHYIYHFPGELLFYFKMNDSEYITNVKLISTTKPS